MRGPSKPMPKNYNSKFTVRNSKQDIFSRLDKFSKKAESDKRTTDTIRQEDKPNS